MLTSATTHPNKPTWPFNPARLGRFALVGGLNTALDFALLALLSGVFGWPTLLANTVSYSAGILNGFVCSRRWVFGDAPRRPWGQQFAQFALVSLGALLLNNLVVALLPPALSSLVAATAALWLAKLSATALGLGWNFWANQTWTFRPQS